MLSVAAFNALLKSLEEPPPNTIFIFATTEPHKIPETVISRCQRHDFRNVSFEQIIACLRTIAEAETAHIDEEVLELIARRAEGGLRDAQSMLDRLLGLPADRVDLHAAQQAFGIVDPDYFFRLSEAVISGNRGRSIELIDEAFKSTIDLRSFLSDFVAHFRNLLVLKSVATEQSTDVARTRRLLLVSSAEYVKLEAQTRQLELFDFQRLFDIAERTAQQALTNNFPRFVIEAGLIKMSAHADLRPLPVLLDTIQKTLQGWGAVVMPDASARNCSPGFAATETVASVRPCDPSAPPPARELRFDPSWQDFVGHVRSREKLVLSTVLKRVSPLVFNEGMLEIEARGFDLDALQDPEHLESLKLCLHSYSGSDQWTVLITAAAVGGHSSGSAEEPSRPMKGSIAAQEACADSERLKQVEHEARTQPVVKTALETFAGSKIERVLPVKFQRL